jgi:hydrogenase maturation protease
MSGSPVRVIGVGSPGGDDWLGWEIAERVRDSMALAARREQFTVSLHDNPGPALLAAWRDAGLVVVIDSVRSGAAPGTVHRMDAGQLGQLPRVSTKNGFGVAEVVALAASLDALPEALVFFGIEVDPGHAGLCLSDAVFEVVPGLVAEIEKLLLNHLGVPDT